MKSYRYWISVMVILDNQLYYIASAYRMSATRFLLHLLCTVKVHGSKYATVNVKLRLCNVFLNIYCPWWCSVFSDLWYSLYKSERQKLLEIVWQTENCHNFLIACTWQAPQKAHDFVSTNFSQEETVAITMSSAYLLVISLLCIS